MGEPRHTGTKRALKAGPEEGLGRWKSGSRAVRDQLAPLVCARRGHRLTRAGGAGVGGG